MSWQTDSGASNYVPGLPSSATLSRGDSIGHAAEHAAMGVVPAINKRSFTPYRLATFGDSRSNVGSHRTVTSGGGVGGEKVAGILCNLRGDMEIVFNGGISGDTAANWNSSARVSTSQTVASLLAETPDLVLIQYGINDIASGTSSATVVGYLQALIDKIVGAGIPVFFESINPSAAGAVTYINGVSAAGGYGSSHVDKAAVLVETNAAMSVWLSGFPSNVAMYVDTSSVTMDSSNPGYAVADNTYQDGTHVSAKGGVPMAAIIDDAITPFFPRRQGQAIQSLYPNGCNRSFLSPTSGRALNFAAIAMESGTATATYEIVLDADGDLCQQYNVSVSALGSGYFSARFGILPDWVGATPFWTAAAGDIMQASADVYCDNGNGMAPIVFYCYARQRIYYDDASNEYATVGGVAAVTSTDYPYPAAAISERLLTPRLAVKAAKGSSTMLSTTALHIYAVGHSTGSFRMRIKNPQWCKVA